MKKRIESTSIDNDKFFHSSWTHKSDSIGWVWVDMTDNNPVREMVETFDDELAGSTEENHGCADKFDELIEEAANIAVDFDVSPNEVGDYLRSVTQSELEHRGLTRETEDPFEVGQMYIGPMNDIWAITERDLEANELVLTRRNSLRDRGEAGETESFTDQEFGWGVREGAWIRAKREFRTPGVITLTVTATDEIRAHDGTLTIFSDRIRLNDEKDVVMEDVHADVEVDSYNLREEEVEGCERKKVVLHLEV